MAGDGIIYNTRRKMQAFAARMVSKEFLNRVYTKILCGYFPDVKDPKTFNEKVQWLKLYQYPNDELVISMTDKVKVRDELEKRNLSALLPELYFACNDVNDIPWDKLPNKFVIKCNHGCAYNIVCTDKSSFDFKMAEKKLAKWMKQDFGLYNIEPHYSRVERKIFAEEYLGDRLVDYKFFCFNGTPEFLYVSRDLINDSEAEIAYYDMNFNQIPLVRDDYRLLENIDKPNCFEDLVAFSKELSKGFPFVRTDFYVIDGKPVFSEMTFTPSAGMMPITPSKYDAEWGKLLKIN